MIILSSNMYNNSIFGEKLKIELRSFRFYYIFFLCCFKIIMPLPCFEDFQKIAKFGPTIVDIGHFNYNFFFESWRGVRLKKLRNEVK